VNGLILVKKCRHFLELFPSSYWVNRVTSEKVGTHLASDNHIKQLDPDRIRIPQFPDVRPLGSESFSKGECDEDFDVSVQADPFTALAGEGQTRIEEVVGQRSSSCEAADSEP
jgi:hypothetical protein